MWISACSALITDLRGISIAKHLLICGCNRKAHPRGSEPDLRATSPVTHVRRSALRLRNNTIQATGNHNALTATP